MNDPIRYSIREARTEEFLALGQLAVEVYAALPGMPNRDEQPEYYQMLADVSKRAANPAIRIIAAAGENGEVWGCVDCIEQMSQYGAGGSAYAISNALGIRLLAVRPEGQGRGIGTALMRFCINRAKSLGKDAVILHSTKAMQIAWQMYEKMDFVRYPAIDFQQGKLEVFGFKRDLKK